MLATKVGCLIYYFCVCLEAKTLHLCYDTALDVAHRILSSTDMAVMVKCTSIFSLLDNVSKNLVR
jgi:hypothetical protein